MRTDRTEQSERRARQKSAAYPSRPRREATSSASASSRERSGRATRANGEEPDRAARTARSAHGRTMQQDREPFGGTSRVHDERTQRAARTRREDTQRTARTRQAGADYASRTRRDDADAANRARTRRDDADAANRARPRQQHPGGRMLDNWRRFGILGVMGIMAIGCILGLAFFARPATSDYERRELTTFPAFTVEGFLDGSFTNGVSLWYADTFPFRDGLVQFSRSLQNLYGIQPQTQLVGGNVKADELPGEETQPSGPATREDVAVKVDPPAERVMQEDIQANIMSGLYVEGDSAYSVYYFDDNAVTTYATALNECADALDGQATVYSVLAPNNSGAKLDEKTLRDLGGSDQKQALDYFHSLMNDKVQFVETYDILREHRDEYTFFRTDHHWTQLGAYYAYVAFCEKAGIEPVDKADWKQRTFAPFLGTLYDQLQLPAMANNPDSVEAWYPNSTNDMTFWLEDGEEVAWNVIYDADSYDEANKYMCFINGDQVLSRVDNPKLDDGSSCLVVKDSYGCAFAPLLVDNFQTLWIIDFRKYGESIPEFVKEHDVKNVVFLNNMAIAGTQTAAEGMLALM